jgi:methylenetetrahydrofolate--tRNA-(uracil-5-)-methyltransferase
MSFPETTMIGALCHYITHADPADYQPMKANFGILPSLSLKKKMNKRQRAAAYSERAIQDLQRYISKEENILM